VAVWYDGDMLRQYVFIDDSGDAGLKKTNTEQLVVAAVIVVDEDKRKLLSDGIDLFRRRLGWTDLHEFKFNKTNKEILVELIDFIKGFDFKAYAVVLDKKSTDSSRVHTGNISIYNCAIKELLLQISKNDQIVVIDGKATKSHAGKIRAYLRQHLKEKGVEKSSIRFVDSRKDSLVQLADIVAGAIARSYKDKTDAKRYLDLLKNKIIKIEEIKL
jgi:hypothetical protein